ncbi:hypothetical protein [Amycolatopsis coloradensis]|uniref:ATP-dependent DNA ligase n=1 Tax=Amycolatopsis coloradensis TaxID=76021 RepID=UPI001FC957F0|nr:hypothetical protein [Amycolatopsis coloradensis]
MRVAGDGTTMLTSRNGNDFTARFPELGGVLTETLGGQRAVLDGEIVALDEHGRPDFGLLQNYAGGVAVAYFVFDVVVLGDERLLDEPYEERRKVLEKFEPSEKNLVAVTPPTATPICPEPE